MTPECMDSNIQLGKAGKVTLNTKSSIFPPGNLNGDIAGCHNGGCREECSGYLGG